MQGEFRRRGRVLSKRTAATGLDKERKHSARLAKVRGEVIRVNAVE